VDGVGVVTWPLAAPAQLADTPMRRWISEIRERTPAIPNPDPSMPLMVTSKGSAVTAGS
jgi:hypothetical protein